MIFEKHAEKVGRKEKGDMHDTLCIVEFRIPDKIDHPPNIEGIKYSKTLTNNDQEHTPVENPPCQLNHSTLDHFVQLCQRNKLTLLFLLVFDSLTDPVFLHFPVKYLIEGS